MAIFSKLVGKWFTEQRGCLKMINLDTLYPPYGIFIPVLSTLFMCVISYYLFKWLGGDATVTLRDATKNHSWKPIKLSSKSWNCSICESLLLNGIGVYCDCCGVCADTECVSKANKTLKCKVMTSNYDVQLHHWIKGNLPLGAICIICQDDCSMDTGLVDFQCCWCQRTIHTKCLSLVKNECDFGPFKNMIVPPWCVQVAKRKSGIRRHILLRGVKDPGWKDWCPLIVVGNRKSGNNDGATILSEFRKYLNPAQVIDLAERKPAAALQWSILVAPKPIRILAAGGDGTVAWILTTSYKLDLEPQPEIAILPLGTGNDLSRVLGWGKESPNELDVNRILTNIHAAKVTNLDRWQVIVSPPRPLGIRLPPKTHYMYNYLSIGVDAQVALDFHRTRDSKFYIFSNRIFNKLLYLCFGTQQVVAADCKNLERRLELFLDGKQIELPELESIVILNIPSWGAGVNLWSMSGEASTQSFKDGTLEVLAIYSSFHIAQLQVGLSTPHRLGQARSIQINLKQKSPMQIDGEPWEQHPTQLNISLVDKATVLVNQSSKNM